MARSGNGKAPERKTINLALQGGGSHGAFTWGVLDALLEDGRIDIDSISGTSSRATKGAVTNRLASMMPGTANMILMSCASSHGPSRPCAP